MKRLIINADDFGRSRGINRGIIEAFKFGTLTSATIMANMPAFEEACTLIKENPGIGIGVHLNIFEGRPLSAQNEVQTLLGKNGDFLVNAASFAKRLLFKRIDFNEIEKEFRTQIEKALRQGIKITHFDSHKHLHCYPPIMRIVIKLAKEYGVNKIRHVFEKGFALKDILNPQYYKVEVLNLLCFLSKKDLERNNIVYPCRFYGITRAGKTTISDLKVFMESFSEGTAEFICHPGYPDSEVNETGSLLGGCYSSFCKEVELKVLLDPKLPQIINSLNIKLISYAQL